jgi:hypothetical protein
VWLFKFLAMFLIVKADSFSLIQTCSCTNSIQVNPAVDATQAKVKRWINNKVTHRSGPSNSMARKSPSSHCVHPIHPARLRQPLCSTISRSLYSRLHAAAATGDPGHSRPHPSLAPSIVATSRFKNNLTCFFTAAQLVSNRGRFRRCHWQCISISSQIFQALQPHKHYVT